MSQPSKKVGDAVVDLVQGDITKFEADAVCNAANSRLVGGGGVDGAIHRAGGPSIMKELDGIRAKEGGCPTGSAVATAAGNLPAKWVFHAVGPVYSGKPEDAKLLASAYGTCMRLAKEKGCASIAFPSISTGVYGYPPGEAAPVAIRAVEEALKDSPVKRATFVLFDEKTLAAYAEALGASG
ncbi:MAG: O-acetyl-ADP-ribose deacetylase [Planctomycetota bacterium]|jgi:O-acetyl-ADP-ribose deacetylase (regulator of RNase III)